MLLVEQFEQPEIVGHREVEEERIGLCSLDQRQHLAAVLGFTDDRVLRFLEHAPEGVEDEWVVVGQHDSCGHGKTPFR
jgi:hypothetical protein